METSAASARVQANPRNADLGRGNTLGRALWLCDWLRERRFPFTAGQLARDMEATKRTALRWLEVAEGLGLVQCDRTRPAWRWSSERTR